ncbi:MAG: GNAT family N-acetyltransferase [Candidatus Omnitrophica bacterium]|nr:GNAT family N-acetyltransferase [Candidatus Omnitrophota bacterium]
MLSTDTKVLEIYAETNLEACRKLWEQLIPSEHLTDRWDVRLCFHEHFQRDLLFVVAREEGRIVGFMPLSFIPENNYYGYFPGEVWKNKTWLEQNHLIAKDQTVLRAMLDWMQSNKMNCHLRYLHGNPQLPPDLSSEDEIGYLFYPKLLNHSMENYYSLFSRKSIKSIRKEVDNFYSRNVIIRTDQPEDYDLMVKMNLDRFGENSYFSDQRFAKSFKALKDLLQQNGWLRMTSVVIDGQTIAVDMGCIYNGAYIILAGGTDYGFPGVAKVINLYHMKEACEKNYDEVDFLCGDFSWKKIFHLSPRPLYHLTKMV